MSREDHRQVYKCVFNITAAQTRQMPQRLFAVKCGTNLCPSAFVSQAASVCVVARCWAVAGVAGEGPSRAVAHCLWWY